MLYRATSGWFLDNFLQPQNVLWNQGLVLVHSHEQPCIAGGGCPFLSHSETHGQMSTKGRISANWQCTGALALDDLMVLAKKRNSTVGPRGASCTGQFLRTGGTCVSICVRALLPPHILCVNVCDLCDNPVGSLHCTKCCHQLASEWLLFLTPTSSPQKCSPSRSLSESEAEARALRLVPALGHRFAAEWYQYFPSGR